MKEAKTNVDKFLDGNEIVLLVENKEKANEFFNEILRIDVVAEIHH